MMFAPLCHPRPHPGRIAFGWVWVCALMLAGIAPGFSQCAEAVSLLHFEAPCGSGLNTGQSFTAPATGTLDSLRLARCTGLDARVVIRTYQGQGPDWNEGSILGEADLVLPGSADGNACFTSGGNGFSGYAEGWFTFSDVALEEGQQYVLHLIQGAAATGCTLPYGGGTAFADNGAKPDEDLAFDLHLCPGTFEFGCTDTDACNFNPAATANDGSCQADDCAGTCGGSAYLDPICGCIPDPSEAGLCVGCTDAAACNFDATSTVDDGSCYYPDCDGACPELIDFYESPCGTGLNYGQSFTASITGYLNSITLARCTGVDARLLVRTYNGDGSEWNQGNLIGEADQTFPGTGDPTTCFISGGNGFSHYDETTFTFTDLGLEAGTQYVFQLAEGVAATGCTVSYPDGTAFGLQGAKPAEDLVFRMSMCPLPLAFGCTDPTACNYDAAAAVEDGSCLFLDCAGTCGGDAYLDPQCGCLGSIAEAGSCVGCTDAAACNFNPAATVGDDSCTYLDCHGDCGGTAIDSDCGCIGGNTGIPASACINGCLTDVTSTSAEACSPGLLYGQSFTADQDGLLERVRLKTCCALDAQLVIRETPELDPCAEGGAGAWNSGTLLGISPLLPSACSGLGACLTTTGVDGYIWREFNFDNLAVQAGRTYVMELTSGVAIASCTAGLSGGHAFNATDPVPGKDLVIALHLCPQDLMWGCTDPASCTYDPQADQEDGSCQYLDCAGVCGGDAIEADGCGCIGGTTGIRTAQCVNGTVYPIVANDGPVCVGTLTGQTLLLPADGFLTELQVYGAPDAAHLLEVHRTDGPNAGQWVASSARDAVTSDCAALPATWVSLPLSEVPVQGGSGYRMDFLQGEGRRTCSADFASGQGRDNTTAVPNADLAFRLVYRTPEPGELVWGCTTPGFCNYSPDATHDDGSCAEEDCHGDCGGTAYTVEGCGCVGGNTGLDAASCYGCLDASKCNYAPNASIDDGSCLEVDCHGECGGTAEVNARCGCVGGSTGIDPALCLDKCQSSPFLSHIPETFDANNVGLAGSGQTFLATETTFLTASRFRQGTAPNSSLTMELRALDAAAPSQGTLLASESIDLWTPGAGADGDLFIEWDEPVLLQAGQSYALVVVGSSTQLLKNTGDPYPDGGSFGSVDTEVDPSDFAFELFTCDDLFGCTDPVACNQDLWATADDASCTYPAPGLDCAGNGCTPDLDGDGICAELDADDDDPFVCLDTDHDGCDDCQSGTFDPGNDGDDDDGDGICNGSDLCSDVNADNYASPENGICRGPCDSAPLFHGIELTSLPSSPTSTDGTVALDLSAGQLPFVTSSEWDAVELVLEAYGAGESMTIDLTAGPPLVRPGLYQTTVYNAAGCAGVASAPGGTTFGQPPVTHLLLVGYPLCCDCGVYDLDRDGLCDDVDACTNRTSPLFDHPDNLPCE